MSMPELRWDETEFIECLEVLPEWGENYVKALFEVERDGLALKVSVRPLDSTIDLILHRCGSEVPLVEFKLFVHGQTELRKEKSGEYLWIRDADLVPRQWTNYEYYKEYGASIRTHTVVLRVNPDIRIIFEGWV
jgi:hypothetical protein